MRVQVGDGGGKRNRRANLSTIGRQGRDERPEAKGQALAGGGDARELDTDHQVEGRRPPLAHVEFRGNPNAVDGVDIRVDDVEVLGHVRGRTPPCERVEARRNLRVQRR